MHGPYSPPGTPIYKAPSWPALPEIVVLDTIAPTLRPKRLRQWATRRAAALDRWATAGLRFTIAEADPHEYPTLDPMGGDAALPVAMVQPYLRLMSIPSLYGGSVPAVATWYPATDPAAFAAFYMADFWLQSQQVQAYRITHEIGHCLGLNHHRDAFSVMGVTATGYWMGTAKPDAHDIEALHNYYQPT